ncbi:hypothetical protein EDD85DRAFT_863003 [Armillaria nabsnona]|nr:hypothetical protein EDD85DRAFT_863003 [Armillaria nabsnona]
MPVIPKSRRIEQDLDSITDPEDYAIAFFAASVKDPDRPKHCGQCLLGCAMQITLGLKEEHRALHSLDNRLLSKRQAFCSSSIYFLTKERTSQQLSELLRGLDTCNCEITTDTIAMYHVHGNHTHDEHSPCSKACNHSSNQTMSLAHLLFDRLAGILRSSSLPKVSKRASHKRWPNSINDIIVDTPQILIDSVRQWNLLLPCPSALNFLAGALCICGRILAVTLTRSDTFLKHLIISVRSLCKRVRKRQVENTTLPLPSLYNFFEAMTKQCPSHYYMGVWASNGGFQVEALRMFFDMIKLCRHPELGGAHAFGTQERCDNAMAFFASLGSSVAYQMDHVPEDIEPKLCVAIGMGDERDERLMWIMCEIKFLRRDTACCVPRCGKTFQEVGTGFKRCSGCRIVPYCSPKCQTKDWNDPVFPHKKTCVLVQRFLDAGKVSITGDGSSTNWFALVDKVAKSELMRDGELLDYLVSWSKTKNEIRSKDVHVQAMKGL